MAIRNYLIEGVSGTGKTTVATELERRGYHVVHGDRVLAYVGDPATGERLAGPPQGTLTETTAWGNKHWIWPVDKVEALVADQSHAVTFFCGGSRNWHHFIGLFDRVFVLDVDFDTLMRRLKSRPDDEFGGQQHEQDLIAVLHATREDIPEADDVIDAARTVDQVVDDILRRCGVS